MITRTWVQKGIVETMHYYHDSFWINVPFRIVIKNRGYMAKKKRHKTLYTKPNTEIIWY
jgi:hypothetical protein